MSTTRPCLSDQAPRGRAEQSLFPPSGKSLAGRGAADRGFTLLEMMVVVIIIGTVVAIAIPRMNDMFEVNLKSAMRRLIGTVQFAFNESVIKQTPLRLNFTPETGDYWLSAMLTSGDTGQFVDYPTDVVKPQQLPAGVYFTDIVTPHDSEKRTEGDDIFIGFFPTGFVEHAVIHLASDDGRQFSLVIAPLTGKVTVLDGYVDIVQQTDNGEEQATPIGGYVGITR